MKVFNILQTKVNASVYIVFAYGTIHIIKILKLNTNKVSLRSILFQCIFL